MWDAALVWGSDLAVSATGDVLLAGDGDLGQQRILRRLLTNTSDYIWQPAYGAGLGQFVGATNIERAAAGVIQAQIFNETSVARQPAPVVTAVTMADGSVAIGIQYADLLSGQSQSLSFSMSS